MIKTILISIVSLALPTIVSSQPMSPTLSPVILNAAGGSTTINNIQFEWSIGESVTTETMFSNGIVITHGVLQPIPTTRVIDNNWSPDEIKVYPVPSSDWVTIQFFSIEIGTVTLRLYDASGKRVYVKQFYYDGRGRFEMLNVSGYASGIYFLRIELDPDLSTQSIHKRGTYRIQALR